MQGSLLHISDACILPISSIRYVAYDADEDATIIHMVDGSIVLPGNYVNYVLKALSRARGARFTKVPRR